MREIRSRDQQEKFNHCIFINDFFVINFLSEILNSLYKLGINYVYTQSMIKTVGKKKKNGFLVF